LRDTGGIERALDYIFYQVAAINGFDSVSHYLRAGLLVNACTQYALTPSPSCTANFQDQGGSATAASAANASAKTGPKPYQDTRRSPDLRRLDAYLRGLDPDKAVPGTTAGREQASPSAPAAPAAPESGAASTATVQPVADKAPSDDATTGPLLDYLMGG
jgi:hypothetical protein